MPVSYDQILNVLNTMFMEETRRKYAQDLVVFIHDNFDYVEFHTTGTAGGDLRAKIRGGKIFFIIGSSFKATVYLQKNQNHQFLALNANGDHVMKGKDVLNNMKQLQDYICTSYIYRGGQQKSISKSI